VHPLDSREPISVVISFDLLRKRRVIMEDVDVSNVEEVGRMARRREVPCVCHSRSLYRWRVVRGAVIMATERKKC
jgi:hypothetical protein